MTCIEPIHSCATLKTTHPISKPYKSQYLQITSSWWILWGPMTISPINIKFFNIEHPIWTFFSQPCVESIVSNHFFVRIWLCCCLTNPPLNTFDSNMSPFVYLYAYPAWLNQCAMFQAIKPIERRKLNGTLQHFKLRQCFNSFFSVYMSNRLCLSVRWRSEWQIGSLQIWDCSVRVYLLYSSGRVDFRWYCFVKM